MAELSWLGDKETLGTVQELESGLSLTIKHLQANTNFNVTCTMDYWGKAFQKISVKLMVTNQTFQKVDSKPIPSQTLKKVNYPNIQNIDYPYFQLLNQTKEVETSHYREINNQRKEVNWYHTIGETENRTIEAKHPYVKKIKDRNFQENEEKVGQEENVNQTRQQTGVKLKGWLYVSIGPVFLILVIIVWFSFNCQLSM